MASRTPRLAVSLALEIGELAIVIEGARRLVAEVLGAALGDRHQRDAAAAAEAILALTAARVRLVREVLVGDAVVSAMANDRNTVRLEAAHLNNADVLLPVVPDARRGGRR